MKKILAAPMEIQAHRKLGIIYAATEGWMDAVRNCIEVGSNFLLVLPKDPDEISKFCRLFGLASDCSPKTIAQSELFRLGQFIDPEAFNDLLVNWSRDKLVLFVEQLDFPVTRPPRTQPFLVYSPVLGILAQAANKAQAKEAFDDYKYNSGLPAAGASIYSWGRNCWNLYEGR